MLPAWNNQHMGFQQVHLDMPVSSEPSAVSPPQPYLNQAQTFREACGLSWVHCPVCMQQAVYTCEVL